jgi:hypothetical protein
MMFVYNYLFDKSNLAKCELRTEHLDIHSFITGLRSKDFE